jgi:hypothetical protein
MLPCLLLVATVRLFVGSDVVANQSTIPTAVRAASLPVDLVFADQFGNEPMVETELGAAIVGRLVGGVSHAVAALPGHLRAAPGTTVLAGL